MADIKISELSTASAVNNTDLFPMTSSGVTVKATAQQIKNYMGVGNITDLDTTDKSSTVAAINEVNTKVSKTEDLISIVENRNTCTHTGGIAQGQYVNWKGDLYIANSNIAVGATFASSGGSKNLSAVSDGGLNKLNTRLKNAISFLNYKDLSSYTGKTLVEWTQSNNHNLFYCSCTGGTKLSDLPITQAGNYFVFTGLTYNMIIFIGYEGVIYIYSYTGNVWHRV